MSLHEWYVHYALTARTIGYFVIMVFFLIWGAWALDQRLYHRASIKLLVAAMLMSFVHSALTRDPKVLLYEVTPIIVILAIVVLWFMFKLKPWTR